MLIGYHNHISAVLRGDEYFDGPAKEAGGIDFMLCHVDPHAKTLKEECEDVKLCAEKIKDAGAKVIINFEGPNFIKDAVTADGYDWANRADGTHLLNVPEEYIKAMNSAGNCLGIMYDEFEHVIINRNISLALASRYKVDMPAFPVSEDPSPLKQGELLSEQLEDYYKDLTEKGAVSLSGEHVWPVLFHKFAKAGIIPNFKSQKESFSNIQFACAAGAAMQYGTPLFNCVDMWFRLTYPGHSAKELYHNLLFAYTAGIDLVYTESVDCMYKKDGDGKNRLTDIGESFCRFVREYRGRERDYSFRDYKPEIAIIRYDDTFWGQGRCRFMWRNMLFGNPGIKIKKASREWVRAFNIITHGETGNGGLSWGRLELRVLRPHRSFASMNGAVVFDDCAKEEQLNSVKLCFLCGLHISGETLETVKKLVRENGLTVVTPPRFAPDNIRKKGFGPKETKDGKGTWIVTKNLKSRALKKRLAPFLGRKGEMTYTFGDKKFRLKIAKDGNSFEFI